MRRRVVLLGGVTLVSLLVGAAFTTGYPAARPQPDALDGSVALNAALVPISVPIPAVADSAPLGTGTWRPHVRPYSGTGPSNAWGLTL